jgi:hypothetical protein
MEMQGGVLGKLIHSRLVYRRGCTFWQRFVWLLIGTGPLLLVLEVIGPGVWRTPVVLPVFLLFSIPGTLLFVLMGTTLEHWISRINR